MASFPLVGRPLDAILFHAAGRTLSASTFLHDAHMLAAALPRGKHLLNACRDRYAFALAFAAALLGGKVCLLPGERAPASLARMADRYGDCILATDDPAEPEAPGMTLHLVRPDAGAAPASVPVPVLPANRLAAIVFTSGSTGSPVAHPKSWGALVERSRAAGRRFDLTEAAPASIVGTVPPQHMYGFETTVLLPLHAAATSWCGPTFFPADMRAALAAMPAPRVLVTTPLQLATLLRAGSRLPELHACISATAPLEADLAAAVETSWRAPVLEIFGATELGSIASRRTVRDAAWTLYPGLALVPGTDGVSLISPHAPPIPLDDAVESLGANRFRLLGRRQDIVKLGGHRASLAALNRILLSLDGVEDGVFVVPEDLGQRTMARLGIIVVAPRRSAASIVRALRPLVEPVFLPRRVIHVDALPRNDLGKLPRRAVLDLLAGRAARAGAA